MHWKAGFGSVAALAAIAALPAAAGGLAAQERFSTDFEKGSFRSWNIENRRGVRIDESGDPAHGKVMMLEPDGEVYALIRRSNKWQSLRVEGDFYFPEDRDAWFGIIYNFNKTSPRTDYGNIYIRSKDGLIRVSPYRDGSEGSPLYEEYDERIAATPGAGVRRWQHFKAEIHEGAIDLYVGDMATPKLTFPALEFEGGQVGFRPEASGGSVWIDNISVTTIPGLSYDGPRIPAITYEPESLLTSWMAFGPWEKLNRGVEHDPRHRSSEWFPLATDWRGAVVTSIVTEYNNERTVGYFRARVSAPVDTTGTLHLSTAEDLAVWVNGRFAGYVDRQPAAWYDFYKNPDHAGRKVRIQLAQGPNDLVIRARGGRYASGGFYAKIE